MQTDDTNPPAGDPPAGDPPAGDPPAGDGGQQANPLLDELKQERRARKEMEKRLQTMEQAQEAARQAALPEQERLVEQARKEARDEAMTEVRRTLAQAKVHAAAATLGFVDPGDAAAHVDLGALDPDDVDAVQAAVKDLAERKPYLLGRAPAAPKVPGGPQGKGESTLTFNDWVLGAVRGRT
jgi:hypothetical protein